MLGNDISNGVPMRVLVHLDVITVTVEEKVPFLKFFSRAVEHEFFDKLVLSNLWRFSDMSGTVMELFATEISQRQLDAKLAWLDEQQAHPFRSATSYPNISALVSELPYRQDIYGVIDLPERGLRYGSRWLDLSRI